MADAETDAKPVDQDALVADIEQTRLQLARTIDAIADRVSPQKNLSRALGEVRQRGPAYGDGRIYAHGPHVVYALDARSGKLLWQVKPAAVAE